jgi:lysophospholipase L1-like esterase
MARVGRVLLLLAANVAVAFLCEITYRAWLFASAPSPDTTAADFELYAVGESTMAGEPYAPLISIPLLLQHMFAGHIDGRSIVLENLAEAAVPLYAQAMAFERAMASRNGRMPGVVLIVAGHNEGIRPGNNTSEASFISSVLTENSAIVRDMLLALRRRRIIPREQTLQAYEYYLRQVIEGARRNSLVPIVATMASNISRIEPNYDRDDADVREIVSRGVALEDQQRFAEARSLYANALRGRDHARAPLEYQSGRCEEALGNFAAARELYWDAVDHDPRTTFGRATRPQNDLVRRLAREYDIPLIDSVAILESHSPHGLLSAEWFADGQHPSLAAYVLLANAYADVISERFHTPIDRRLASAAEAIAAFNFPEEDMRGALVNAGAWLIATSVNHPLPRDRAAIATTRFRAALGKGDDFSAWLGIGLAQAALRGGLRGTDPIAYMCQYGKQYNLSPENVVTTVDRLAALGVDADIVERIRVLGHVDHQP